MEQVTRMKWLRISLIFLGAIALFGLYPLTVLWPAGFAWHHGGQSSYLQMIIGIYATLGIFLMIAARRPMEHLSLIWFTVWSSVVHGGIMAVQSLVYPEHRAHLWGDVPLLFAAAVILGVLTPRKQTSTA